MPVFRTAESSGSPPAAAPNPDALMRHIDKLISVTENIRANRQLAALNPALRSEKRELQAAEEAFKMALAQRDEESTCPPEKLSPLGKIHRLISAMK